MQLAPMRFKDFVWPHNPNTYEILFERKMAVNKVPQGRYIMQNMGLQHRILRGEGEFIGDDAYSQFSKLASLFYAETPGPLIHPIWQTANAYFVKLWLKQIPLQNYVSYGFEFWESFDGYESTLTLISGEQDAENGNGKGESGTKKQYVVKPGDTLWGIAVSNGISLSDLLASNPDIKNPNMIYPGDTIFIPGGRNA